MDKARETHRAANRRQIRGVNRAVLAEFRDDLAAKSARRPRWVVIGDDQDIDDLDLRAFCAHGGFESRFVRRRSSPHKRNSPHCSQSRFCRFSSRIAAPTFGRCRGCKSVRALFSRLRKALSAPFTGAPCARLRFMNHLGTAAASRRLSLSAPIFPFSMTS